MDAEDPKDPDGHDLHSAGEEFAGWDPYVIRLCRSLASPPGAEPVARGAADDDTPGSFV